jgi:Domain of unknown function (DUF4288)
MESAKKKNGWYTVRVLIRCTGDGQPIKVPLYEDRLILVKAASHPEAKRKAAKSVKDTEAPYKNTYGKMVRWKLSEVVESVELFPDEKLDGMQVYWRYIYAKDPLKRLQKERARNNGCIGDSY